MHDPFHPKRVVFFSGRECGRLERTLAPSMNNLRGPCRGCLAAWLLGRLGELALITVAADGDVDVGATAAGGLVVDPIESGSPAELG